jgi:hypothetical protein
MDDNQKKELLVILNSGCNMLQAISEVNATAEETLKALEYDSNFRDDFFRHVDWWNKEG